MAVDSLFSVALPTGAAATKLENILKDSQLATVIKTNLGDAGSAVTAVGSTGESQTAVVTKGNAGVTASLTDSGGVKLNIQIPGGTGLAFTGTRTDAVNFANELTKAANSYLGNAVDDARKAAEAPGATDEVKNTFKQIQQARDSINDAIKDLSEAIKSLAAGKQVQQRTVSFVSTSTSLEDSDHSFAGVDSLVGANDILLDASGNSDATVFNIDLTGTTGKTIALQGATGAILASTGTVRVEGSTPIVISSDLNAQNITGGGGNDTLIGSGNDTMAGGAGNDIFGFKNAGKYTISDFNKAADKFAFEISGVSTVDQLKAKVTSVQLTSNGIVYNFGPDNSITLVGVAAGQITADMIKFKIIG